MRDRGCDATRSQQGGPEHAKAPLVSIASPHASKLVSMAEGRRQHGRRGNFFIAFGPAMMARMGISANTFMLSQLFHTWQGHLWHSGEPCESLRLSFTACCQGAIDRMLTTFKLRMSGKCKTFTYQFLPETNDSYARIHDDSYEVKTLLSTKIHMIPISHLLEHSHFRDHGYTNAAHALTS